MRVRYRGMYRFRGYDWTPYIQNCVDQGMSLHRGRYRIKGTIRILKGRTLYCHQSVSLFGSANPMIHALKEAD